MLRIGAYNALQASYGEVYSHYCVSLLLLSIKGDCYLVSNIWEEFLKIVREEVGSRVVETWFKAVSLHTWDSLNKTVYLEAPNKFVHEWIENNYIRLIQLHLERLLNIKELKVILVHGNKEKKEEVNSDQDSLYRAAVVSKEVEQKKSPLLIQSASSSNYSLTMPSLAKHPRYVNKSYVFDTFVVGPSNSLAYAAAHAITEKLGRIYNPLFLYGGSGLGKTHLLHAIANEIRAKNKRAVIVYQTADRFVNEFINAIRFDKMHKFQTKYQDIDVLLIDDIQFISNKEQTQEAFFHIFNSLYDAHTQIVFSGDTFPQNINGLAERLRSRLAWGLVADIHVPSLEVKVAILKKKVDLQNEVLDDDVAYFIASRVVSNIRELEGALIRVMAFASLTNQSISLELAKKVLMRTEESQSCIIDCDCIIKYVSKYYSYDIEKLKSKSRNKKIAFARHVAMFLIKKITDKSLRDIGMFLGGRDHSTVIHAIAKIQKHADNHPEFKEQLQRIEREITR